MFSGIRRWDLVLMLSLIAAIATVELLGVFSPRMVTITQLVKSWIPIPVRVMILAWLNWHMLYSDIVRQVTPK